MIEIPLIVALFLGIALLLLLILYFRLPAFISLLIASIVIGILSGLSPEGVVDTIQRGMGGTLGFVATIVGLGAMFGAILEMSGGAQSIAQTMINKMGTERAPIAMMLSGFFIAIPVFFDVAFIILVPVIYALQRKTGKSLLLYAIPLLAGLAATHAFIPPTPGPVAVADIIGVDLGWVIAMGFVVGLPATLISGLYFGRYIAARIHVSAPAVVEMDDGDQEMIDLPSFSSIASIIALPIVLILFSTMKKSGLINVGEGMGSSLIDLMGHPFSALILANLIAWYVLGIRRGLKKDELFDISMKSMAPAGTIILLTGAGGVLKQTLVDTNIGATIAEGLVSWGLPVTVFAFVAACLVRVLQGSSTVAMITAAGLVSPLLASSDLGAIELALLVIAIASGSSILSHVNDSGYWLVSQYLGISEKETFRSWSMMTTILALTGFMMVMLISLFV